MLGVCCFRLANLYPLVLDFLLVNKYLMLQYSLFKNQQKSSSQAMLQIEPVSKFRKEAYSRLNKAKNKNNEPCPDYLNRPFTLHELQQQLDDVKEEPYSSRQFEDSHLTKFLHEQLITIRLTMNLLAVTSILLSFMQSIASLGDQTKQIILGIHSVIALGLILLVSVKHFKGIQLQEKQLIRLKRESTWLRWFKAVSLESIVLLIHPNWLCDKVVIHIPDPTYGQTTPFSLNNFFEILMLGRIYLCYRSLIETSIYCTPRANRMRRIYNSKNETNFGIKSVFNNYPIQSLQILFSSLVLILSQMLKLADETNPYMQNFQNAVWCIIITMGTIGYGDVIPSSYLARVIAFCAAISGIILSSLLILTLSQKLAMNCKESKSHVTLERLQLRMQLEEYAQQAIMFTTQMAGGTMNDELKKKTQVVKLTLRRLKNKIDTDNLNEEINNLFDSLYGNLMEIYLQQQRYADELMFLRDQERDRINEIHFTFAAEIEDIIRDR